MMGKKWGHLESLRVQDLPWPMDTVIRIFSVMSPCTAVYGEKTARFCAVFHRNPGNRITGRLRYRDCTVYGRMYAVFSLDTVVNHDPELQ